MLSSVFACNMLKMFYFVVLCSHKKGDFMADKVFTMRIDEDLLELIRKSAERNKRSVAKEIEYTLEFHYQEGVPIEVPDDVAKLYAELIRQSEGYKILEQRIKEAEKKLDNKS